jgi:threonine dehydrogenase-like Zn-dependent dehydrogenase
MSKSILVIGLGRFGVYLTKKFFELGDEVMAVDIDEEKIQEIMPYVVGAKIANCRNPETLRSIGVGDFDLCFVCIGTNFQSSLEITCLLKELGAKKVISKANNEFHAKFLERNGADKVVYPEKYSAGKLAIKYSSDKVIEGFYEKNLQGKSVRDEESYETLDVIFADKVFDQGFYYNIGKYRGTMSTKFKTGDTTFASFYAEQEQAAKLELKKINDLYKGLLDD